MGVKKIKKNQVSSSGLELIVSTRDFFLEILDEALESRKMSTSESVRSYVSWVLDHYVITEHLFDEEGEDGKRNMKTLAETLLEAMAQDPFERRASLRKLGEKALIVSGFFGESLGRKVIDVDYYIDMGRQAYLSLADMVREEENQEVYRTLGQQFLNYVEILNYISNKADLKKEENILRLYESYALTGSEKAREELLKKGLLTVNLDQWLKKKQ